MCAPGVFLGSRISKQHPRESMKVVQGAGKMWFNSHINLRIPLYSLQLLQQLTTLVTITDPPQS